MQRENAQLAEMVNALSKSNSEMAAQLQELKLKTEQNEEKQNRISKLNRVRSG